MNDELRHDWPLDELRAVYDTPLLELVFQAATVHRRHHNPREMQVSKLISIKTGACPEDCSYCAQSSRYNTGVGAERMMDKCQVVVIATRA
jgi:biotin synthase